MERVLGKPNGMSDSEMTWYWYEGSVANKFAEIDKLTASENAGRLGKNRRIVCRVAGDDLSVYHGQVGRARKGFGSFS